MGVAVLGGMWLPQRGCGSPQPHLHSHVGHDGALVALQRLQGDLANLALRLAQEHLAGGCQHLLVLPLDLHLRGGWDHLGTPQSPLAPPKMCVAPLRG